MLKNCPKCKSAMEEDSHEGVGLTEATSYICTNEDCGHSVTEWENGEVFES